MTNHLYILLELFPNKPWDYYHLSRNPNITWNIVKANPNKPWDYKWLSKNPNITWDIVKANPDKRWNYFWLSMNKFNKDPYLVKKRSMIKYGIIWLNKTRETKEYQRLWKIEYSASMDILKLRQRDFELTRD